MALILQPTSLKPLWPQLLLLLVIWACAFVPGKSEFQGSTVFNEEQRARFSGRVASLLQSQEQAPTRGADEDAKARAQCDRYFNNYILKCTGGEGGLET